MGKFLPGNPGKKKGTKNKKKVLKIGDFLIRENVDVAKTWWEAIMSITNPKDKSDAINQFYKFIGTPPKPDIEPEVVENEAPADILSIIKNDEK